MFQRTVQQRRSTRGFVKSPNYETEMGTTSTYSGSWSTERSFAMNRIVYIVGLIVIVLVVLSFLGLR